MSSPKEKHGDGKESKTPVDQPSQDVTGSNPSVSNPCGDVTGPEPFYQRPEVRIAPLCFEGNMTCMKIFSLVLLINFKSTALLV